MTQSLLKVRSLQNLDMLVVLVVLVVWVVVVVALVLVGDELRGSNIGILHASF